MLAVPSPRTFNVQEVEVASYLNSVRDALNFLLNPPLASLYQVATTSLSAGTWTALGFDSATVDTYGGHSGTTNPSRYTAQVSGWYECSGAVCTTVAQTTGFRSAMFQVNGSRYQGSAADLAASGDNTTVPTPSTPIYLNAGDYVELIGYSSVTTTTRSLNDLASRMNVRWAHT